MARASKWSEEARKKLLKMVTSGVPEQEIREKLSLQGKPMSAVEFAQQLKMAMVEAGQIKQIRKKRVQDKPRAFEVTSKGRLTITNFTEVTGYKSGAKFRLEKPRGRSKAWRLVPD
jgi:hypothetical protein